MRRRSFNLAAAVSLVLFVATITAWMFSRGRPIFFSVGGVRFSAQFGHIWVHWESPYQPVPSSSRSRFLARRRIAFVDFVKTDSVVHDPSGTVKCVRCDLYMPLWELAGLFSLAPAAWTIRRSLAAAVRPVRAPRAATTSAPRPTAARSAERRPPLQSTHDRSCSCRHVAADACSLIAWGGEGHQIVALIAENHLIPKAKAALADPLGPDVHISDPEIASWADEIRRQERDTADWHGVNIAHDASAFDRKRDRR